MGAITAKKTWKAADVKQFKQLAAMWCSRDEVCAVMGVSAPTLNRLIDESLHDELLGPDAPGRATWEDACERYAAAGRAALRRRQYQLAMSGDKTMLIFLGKVYLGQRDKDPTTVINLPARDVEVTPLDAVSKRRAELRAGAED